MSSGRKSRSLVLVWTVLAAGFTALCAIPTVSTRWQRGVALQDVKQRFPREFVRDAIARVGDGEVSVASTLSEVNIAGAGAFLPFDVSRAIYDPTHPTRYVPFDVMDLWVDRRIERLVSPPLGRVICQSANPRQGSIWQYHGFTARQRGFLRRIDASMRLFEVDVDGMMTGSRAGSR